MTEQQESMLRITVVASDMRSCSACDKLKTLSLMSKVFNEGKLSLGKLAANISR